MGDSVKTIAKDKSGRTRGRGYKMLLGLAGLTTISGFLVDWNRTHLFNPAWTPHSKYHNAQTISLAALLGAAGLYFLLQKKEDQRRQLRLGTLLPVLFWSSMIPAFAFPNAKGMEAEFPELVPKVGRVWINEGPISLGMLLLLGTGYLLERKKLP